MASTTTSEIEHICFRINPCLLETCCKISLFSSCFGWINYFREQQWSTYNLPGAVLTTRDAEVNRPSMGLLAVQETDRGKVYCWWELPWGYRKESPILNAKGFTPPPPCLSGILKNKNSLFLLQVRGVREGGVPAGREWHTKEHRVVMVTWQVQEPGDAFPLVGGIWAKLANLSATQGIKSVHPRALGGFILYLSVPYEELR